MDAWSSGTSHLLTFIQGSRQVLFCPYMLSCQGQITTTGYYCWLINTHTSTQARPGTGLNSGSSRSKQIKGSKECLFIMTQTHSLHISGEIPFVKL